MSLNRRCQVGFGETLSVQGVDFKMVGAMLVEILDVGVLDAAVGFTVLSHCSPCWRLLK